MPLFRASDRRTAGSLSAVTAAVALTIALTACTAPAASDVTAAVANATGTPTAPVGPNGVTQPVPGASSTPDPTTWSTAVAPAGFTVVIVTAVAPGTDPELDAAVDAVRSRATSATVRTATVWPGASGSGDPFAEVLAGSPDLVVVLGPELLDAADRSSASNLGRQFLIVGAQLPEPTANVTAVVWPGASARRADEPRTVPNGMPEVAQRAGDAFQAGLAALLEDTTGGVLVLS